MWKLQTKQMYTLLLNRNFHNLSHISDIYVYACIGNFFGSLFFNVKNVFNISKSYWKKYKRPGHGPSLQVTVSVLVPEQNFPPCNGAGFEQVLWRDFMPSPHVFEQELKGVHALQLPSTKKNNFRIWKYFNMKILIKIVFNFLMD